MTDPTANLYTAFPPQGAGPGVLVLHAWWGLTELIRQLCDRLAAEGYVAVAPDLYNGKLAATIPEAEKLLEQFDGQAAADTAEAALDRLIHLPAAAGRGTAVIGFSLGAGFALWLADYRPQDLPAAVVFYGNSGRTFREHGGACLGHFAEHDPYEPAEGVRDLEERLAAAGRRVEFNVYPGTGHWFFEQDRPDAYHPEAAALAWDRTLAFLRRELK